MNEQLKKFVDPVRNFWGKLARKTKIILLSVLGGIVLLAVVLGLLMNRTQYTVLYAGLASDEAQQVMAELKDMDVGFKDENGTIYVESDKENSARMQLSNEGYPKSAPNYDFFTDHVGVMTTDEERKIIEQYQLQERLSAVIRTMDPVDTAYVTISLPQGSSYAWDDNKQAASAAVSIRLKPGKTMVPSQVAGVKQLVSKSVPDLSAQDVTVVDSSSGVELSSSSSKAPEAEGSLQITLSEFKLKIEKEYEDSVQQKVLDLLAQGYGRGNISVSVKSKMDLDKKIQDIVTYTPSTSDGRGVVSQSDEEYEQTVQGASSVGGVAGAQQNTTTTTTYPGVTVSGNVITTKDKKTYTYLVSQVEEQIQSDAAALDDLTVSVLITADGITEARRQELTNLVANAAAVDPSKVAVMAVPTAESAPESQAVPTLAQLFPQVLQGSPFLFIAGGLLLVLLALLIVLFVARRKREREKQILERLAPEGGPEGGEAAFQPLVVPAVEPPRTAGTEEPAEQAPPEEEPAAEEPQEPEEEEEEPEEEAEPEEEEEEPEEEYEEEEPEEEAEGGEEEQAEEPEEPAEENAGPEGPEEPEAAAEEGEEENVKQTPQEPKETIEEIRNAQNGKEEELKNDLQEFSSTNPEIAAQLIRSWLKGDDGRGRK